MNNDSEILPEKPEVRGTWKKNLLDYGSLLVAGIGIGWLVGLSVSPVISIVVTSVVGSTAAFIAAFSGLEEKFKDSTKLDTRTLDALPIAILVIGLVIGSFWGIRARTHNWLEPDIALEIDKWTSVGLPREMVVNEVFKSQLVISNGESKSQLANEGVLFSIGNTECSGLLGKTGDELKQELATSTENLQLRQLPEIVQDVDILKELVEKVLCSD